MDKSKNFKDKNFSGDDFRDRQLVGADLREAILRGVDAVGTNLERAKLYRSHN